MYESISWHVGLEIRFSIVRPGGTQPRIMMNVFDQSGARLLRSPEIVAYETGSPEKPSTAELILSILNHLPNQKQLPHQLVLIAKDAHVETGSVIKKSGDLLNNLLQRRDLNDREGVPDLRRLAYAARISFELHELPSSR
ncbi:hypothetical protein HYV72_02305 [Candidatus Uhrbacteria bacterium]|nr:hypothetical protein [Candidatus Uhrbacteria bacterium]